MKKILTQLTVFLLFLVLLTGSAFASSQSGNTLATADSEAIGSKIVRIGLYYDSNSTSKDGANLENVTGSGFRFGYYDNANKFTPLAEYTGDQAISIVKTENVYYGTYGNYTSYHDNLTSSSVGVGCYHLQLPDTYSTYESALEVTSGYQDSFVAYINGSYYVRIGNYLSSSAASTAQSNLSEQGVTTTIAGTSAYGISVVIEGTNTMLFQYDDKGNGTGLGVEPIPSKEGEKCLTKFVDAQWFGGFRFERVSGGDLTIVNMVGLDDYIKGVITREMSASWPLEALKAQAVCARTYTLSNLNRHQSAGHFDVCRTVCCQAYFGNDRATNNSNRAVEETTGVVASYNGTLISCVYYSSNGGASEDSSLVWGSNQSFYPYLIGKYDPYEATINIPSYTWTRTYTAAELTSALNSLGYANSTITSVRVSSYTDTGNPAAVTFTDSNGRNYTISAYKMMKQFGFRSWRYDLAGTDKGDYNINGDSYVDNISGYYVIDGSGNVTLVNTPAYVITDEGIQQMITSGTATGSTFTFSGKGNGHNVGMSQYGAYAMSNLGYTYDQILTFYYTGITVGQFEDI